jgi:MFS family permease
MSPLLPRRLSRHVLIDVSPLRRSRDFRALITGLGVSSLGSQLTAVAVPFQVYALTHSSLYVGLVSLAQLFPLIFGSLFGGSLVDSVDRRRLLLVVEVLGAASSAGLALNADLGPALWPLFVFPAVTAALSGMDSSARNAMVPGMVGLASVPAANAMFQALFQTGSIVGPAAAGLLLAGAGVHLVYWLNVFTFLFAAGAAFLISPQPPRAVSGVVRTRPGWRSTAEGLRFVRRTQTVQGAYLIDLNAMVFGLPRALFPAMAATVFGGGATTVGLLYAAPGFGALFGALSSGWVTRIRRQGLAVIVAVIAWGLAITGFGLVRFLPAALVLLAVAGWADVVSAVFRNTIIQFAGPESLRGRLMGVQMAVVAGGPRLGDVEAGVVATAFGDTFAVVSGGLACIFGALAVARLLPEFRHQRSEMHAVTVSPDGAADSGDAADGATSASKAAEAIESADAAVELPAQFAEPVVVDAEVMGDLVDDSPAHLVGDLLLGPADREDRLRVDRDVIGRDHRVRGCAVGQRDALVEAEQARWARGVLDLHDNVAHQPGEMVRQVVKRVDDHLLEMRRLDLDHSPLSPRTSGVRQCEQVRSRWGRSSAPLVRAR